MWPPAGSPPEWPARSSTTWPCASSNGRRLPYCATYCTLVTQHHWGEDVEIFPRLRRGDDALAPVLDRLEEEHIVIHRLLDEIDATLVRIVTGHAGPADLGLVVDRLTDALLSHLSYEERELLAPMAAVFG